MVDVPSFHTRVADECGKSARALMEMADRFRELGDPTMAGLADLIATRLSKIAYDANVETQPIELPKERKNE